MKHVSTRTLELTNNSIQGNGLHLLLRISFNNVVAIPDVGVHHTYLVQSSNHLLLGSTNSTGNRQNDYSGIMLVGHRKQGDNLNREEPENNNQHSITTNNVRKENTKHMIKKSITKDNCTLSIHS